MPGISLLHDEQTQTGQVRVMTKTRFGFYETTQQNKKRNKIKQNKHAFTTFPKFGVSKVILYTNTLQEQLSELFKNSCQDSGHFILFTILLEFL